jgi:hypothetical protein
LHESHSVRHLVEGAHGLCDLEEGSLFSIVDPLHPLAMRVGYLPGNAENKPSIFHELMQCRLPVKQLDRVTQQLQALLLELIGRPMVEAIDLCGPAATISSSSSLAPVKQLDRVTQQLQATDCFLGFLHRLGTASAPVVGRGDAPAVHRGT